MFDLCIIPPEARYRSIRKFFKWQRNAIILYEKLLKIPVLFYKKEFILRENAAMFSLGRVEKCLNRVLRSIAP